MLRWIEREVSSPYGDVATLHWAVPDDLTTHDEDDMTQRCGECSTADDDHDAALESAENQLGAVLWNSNTAALEYLHTHVFARPTVTPGALRHIHVIELGAGVGCLGIALAMAGARVVLTDLKELLPLMRHNVRRNAARVARRSGGVGCAVAEVWRWGPSVSLNTRKRLRKVSTTAESDGVALAVAAMRAALAPSESWQACQRSLQSARVDFVVLCDALYGNPKDWPQLLYTLSEILEANPDHCEVVNFCEQRVEHVEDGFLQLLRDENDKPSLHLSSTPLEKLCAELFASPRQGGGVTPAQLLEYVLRLKRGDYVWDYSTEVVRESTSELHMTIRATRLRWRRRSSPAAADKE